MTSHRKLIEVAPHCPSTYCQGSQEGPPASRYANASSNALASWRSAVSKPSVNQP